jgi:hypothetical protein
MNYEKIDVCEKNCILFWKEHKDNTECMHYGRSRYVKVINEDGASITTTVVVKQLHYIPMQKNGATNEVAHDSKDVDIILHPVDAKAWNTLDHFDPEFARDPKIVRVGLSTDGFHPYSSDSTA